jgi:hypothetical protein
MACETTCSRTITRQRRRSIWMWEAVTTARFHFSARVSVPRLRQTQLTAVWRAGGQDPPALQRGALVRPLF